MKNTKATVTASTVTLGIKRHLAGKGITTPNASVRTALKGTVWTTTVLAKDVDPVDLFAAMADYRPGVLGIKPVEGGLLLTQGSLAIEEVLAAEAGAAKEAKAAERKEKADELHAKLEAAVASLDDEERWESFIRTISVFAAKYSMGNQMLIWSEAARRGFEPTLVKPFGAWREAGHLPRKGEKGLPIWAPCKRRLSAEECDERESKDGKRIPRGADGKSRDQFMAGFRITYVWDVSQVNDPETVEVPEPVRHVTRVRVSGPQPELLQGADLTGKLAEVIGFIESKGLTFSYVPQASLRGANGNTNGKVVNVRDDVSDAQKMKTSVHELAHNLLGHVADDYDYVGHRGRAETEAESVAYIVLGALGLDSGKYSAPYVKSWSEGKPELIKETAERVIAVSKQILAVLSAPQKVQEPAEVQEFANVA